MQRATRDVLYYETGRDNPVTMTVSPGEVFEVETQMNRGRDSSEVPEELRDLWNSKRSDDSPTDRGNPTSGAIWVGLSWKVETRMTSGMAANGARTRAASAANASSVTSHSSW